MSNDDLTPFEQEMMNKLPRERVPGSGLEDRVVDALREQGTLVQQRRGGFRLTLPRVAAAVAASIALLVGGFAAGRLSAPAAVPANGPAVQIASSGGAETATEASPVMDLQQAGTAYIQAIERFAAGSGNRTPLEMELGREVALTTLYAAADEVTRVIPREYLAGQFMVALNVAENERRLSGETTARPRAVRF